MFQKKHFIILSFMLVLVSLSFGDMQVPRYSCQPISQAPQIDGILDDACWGQLPTVGLFIERIGIVSSVQTSVMIAYDSNNLYLGARLDEPAMDKIVANITEHDGGVWQDDVFEFLIATKLNPGKYFQFCINSIGATDETRDLGLARAWNGCWKSAAKREKKAWTIEIMIPFKTLEQNCPDSGAIWKMNFCRNRAGASRHLSSWSATPSFVDTDRYGEVVFLKNKILNKLSASVKTTPEDNEINFNIEANSGDYTVKYYWLENNEEVAREKKIVVQTGELTKLTENFPLSEKLGLGSVELFSTFDPNKILFRSEHMVSGKIDTNAVMLRSIQKIINNLETKEIPQFLNDAKATWPERVNSLKKNGDNLSVKRLLQECKVAKWATNLDSKWKSKPILWFSLPPFTATDYEYIPKAADLDSKISIKAMLGEYEPSCVNILLLDYERDIVLKANNLSSSTSGVFDANNIDIRVLKYWHQAGSGYEEDITGRTVWTGELLLKDDSIVEVNHISHRNIFHSNVDSSFLKPVHINRFENRQFWLTAYIPPRQAPGVYRGYAEAVSDKNVLIKIPIEITVLPLAMEPTKFTFSMYYNRKYSNGKDPNNDAHYEEDLRIAAAHGLTSVPINEGAAAEMKDGFVVSYDFSMIRKALELRKKYGLTGKTFIWGFWDMPPIYGIFKVSEEQLISEPQHKANMIKFCKEYSEILTEFGIDGYCYSYDEPGYDSTGQMLRMCRMVNQWINEGNMKSLQAITLSAAKELDYNGNLPNLDLPSGMIGERRRVLPFKEVWFYTHPLENPMNDRFVNGPLIWYGGYTGSAPYAYNSLGEWDEWDDYSAVYRPMHYAYNGEKNPVLTWQYEAFREGSDDVRYLEMLEKRIKKAEEIGFDKFSAEDKSILIQAKNLLDIPPEKFRGGAIQVPLKLTANDFSQFREILSDLLVETESILSRSKTVVYEK